MVRSEKRLSFVGLLGFASPEIPLIGLMMPVVVFLPPLYATYVGIPLETVGIAFLVSRLWDVVTDPVMGIIADRVKIPFGRRKALMLLSAPFLMLGVWMAFRPPADVSLLYLIGWMIVLYTSFTIANISHYAWAAEMSDDYHERARIMGGLQGGQVVGSLIVLAVVALLQGYLMLPQNEAVAGIGLLITILVPLTFIIAIVMTPERAMEGTVKLRWAAKNGPVSDLEGKSIWRDQAVWRLLVADLLNGFSTGHIGGLFIFLTGITFGLGALSGQLLLVYYISGLITVPFWVWVSRQISKHKAMGLAAIATAVASLGALFVVDGSATSAFIFCLCQGVGLGAAAFLPRAVMADVIDKDELLSGRQRSATFYALLTMTLKVGMALSIGLSYWCLSYVGFSVASLTGSNEAENLRIIYTAGIVFVNIPIVLIMWKFPLNLEQQLRTREKLEQMRLARVKSN